MYTPCTFEYAMYIHVHTVRVSYQCRWSCWRGADLRRGPARGCCPRGAGRCGQSCWRQASLQSRGESARGKSVTHTSCIVPRNLRSSSRLRRPRTVRGPAPSYWACSSQCLASSRDPLSPPDAGTAEPLPHTHTSSFRLTCIYASLRHGTRYYVLHTHVPRACNMICACAEPIGYDRGRHANIISVLKSKNTQNKLQNFINIRQKFSFTNLK